MLGSGGPPAGQPGYVAGFLGGVVADEPRAVLAGREVLSAGGTAADAAVAVGLTLAVTLPSRAGLGGGGACIAYAPDPQVPRRRRARGGDVHAAGPARAGARRGPAGGGADDGARAVPAARPLRQPAVRGAGLVGRATGALRRAGLARPGEGHALVSGPLLADPGARAVFSQNGVPLTEGQLLRQPDLGGTLAQLRVAGVGDMYQGILAHRIALASTQIGGPMQLSDLRRALPKLAPPLIRRLPQRQGRVPAAAGRWRPGSRGRIRRAGRAIRTTLRAPSARRLAVAGALSRRAA